MREKNPSQDLGQVLKITVRLSLVCGTEYSDTCLALLDDGLCTRLQKLTRIVALTLKILTSLDVRSGRLGKYDLKLGIYVDL